MLNTKFKIIAWSAVMLWLVVLMQTVVTRLYVSQTAFEQAFARNQIAVEKNSAADTDVRNVRAGNQCREGVIQGRLTEDAKQELAQDMFRDFGGEVVMSSVGEVDESYFVAYGYTRGIKKSKKVNGKSVNLTVAISYDEGKNVTRVVMGTPLVNSDF